MQTFLPYPDFAASARALDDRRLGKQRVEVLQMLNVLTGVRRGWRNHPAVRMWRGYELALALYGVAVCDEWRRRGFRDTCREKICTRVGAGDALSVAADVPMPPWLGDEQLHASHRRHLIRKDPAFYGPRFGEVPDIDLVWPETHTSSM